MATVLLGAAKTFAMGSPTEDLLVLTSWIVIVAAIRMATGWKATAVVSVVVWIVFYACLALLPDARGFVPSLPLMIPGCIGGCIVGLTFYALAELLCRVIGWASKLLCRDLPGTGCEPTLICPKRPPPFQFSVPRLLPLAVLALLPVSWLGTALHGVLKDTRIVAQYGNLKPVVGRSFFLGRVRLLWFVNPETKPSDADLESLGGLTSLRALLLSHSDVTDSGLQFVEGLPQLRTLSINSPNVTDAGLAHLRSLTNLRDVDLTDTNITDVGLELLKRLNGLQDLSLAQTNVTDAGLAHLRPLINLKVLNLSDTKITDAGLQHLTRLTQLRWLNLRRTPVTDKGARTLQHALPQCRIIRRIPDRASTG